MRHSRPRSLAGSVRTPPSQGNHAAPDDEKNPQKHHHEIPHVPKHKFWGGSGGQKVGPIGKREKKKEKKKKMAGKKCRSGEKVRKVALKLRNELSFFSLWSAQNPAMPSMKAENLHSPGSGGILPSHHHKVIRGLDGKEKFKMFYGVLTPNRQKEKRSAIGKLFPPFCHPLGSNCFSSLT